MLTIFNFDHMIGENRELSVESNQSGYYFGFGFATVQGWLSGAIGQ